MENQLERKRIMQCKLGFGLRGLELGGGMPKLQPGSLRLLLISANGDTPRVSSDLVWGLRFWI